MSGLANFLKNAIALGVARYARDAGGKVTGLMSPSGNVINIDAEKSNLPEIALNRYRSIPNDTHRKIAWVGDSVTQQASLYAFDSRNAATMTLDTPDTLTVTDIAADGTCTTSAAHNFLVGTITYSATTANGFVNNVFYRVIATPSPTTFKVTDIANGAVTLTAGSGLSITLNHSTSVNFYDNAISRYAGAPFYKVTNGAFGSNGQSAAGFLATKGDANAISGFESVVSFAPNLIIYAYGINDVRLGITSQAQLETTIRATIEAFQEALPDADIMLRMPNHLCYDAATKDTYFGVGTTLAQAQARSDALRLAYRAMVNQYPHCCVLDVQRGEGAIFSEKVPSAIGTYMSDAIHPSINEGQKAIFREVCLALGDFGSERSALLLPPVKFMAKLPKALSADATASSASDYLICPRVLEDTSKYNLLLKGVRLASAKGSYWDISRADNSHPNAVNYTNIIKPNDIAILYGTKEFTPGSQGEYFDNGVVAFKLTTANAVILGNNLRILSMPAGYPFVTSVYQEVAFYRARPAAQKRPCDPDFDVTVSALDFSAATINKTVERFAVCGVITGIANTAPTTGGTVTLQKNGVTFATLTWANGATTATGSGTFFTDATRGIVFDEGDVISVVVNAGFAGGAIPKIRFANH